MLYRQETGAQRKLIIKGGMPDTATAEEKVRKLTNFEVEVAPNSRRREASTCLPLTRLSSTRTAAALVLYPGRRLQPLH